MDQISRRDFFAGQALSGLLAGQPDTDPDALVALAFKYAAKMETHEQDPKRELTSYEDPEFLKNSGF